MDTTAPSRSDERLRPPLPRPDAGGAPAAPATTPASPDGPGAPPSGPGRRRFLTRRRLVLAGAALLAVALLVVLLRPAPVDVETGRVVSGPLEVTVDAEGVTRVHDLYRVAAPVGGRLQRVLVREGDRVEVGTVVARIAAAPLDPRLVAQARAQLAAALAVRGEAAARVSQAGAAVDQAARTAARLREMYAAGGVSREERELAELEQVTAEREREAAESRLRAAEAEIAAARAALLDVDPAGSTGRSVTPVRAAVAGRVLRIHEESERVVPAGAPLLDLGDARRLEVVTDVLSTDAVAVRAGALLRVENWGGDEALQGRVRLVEPAGFTKVSALGVEEQRVNVVADLSGVPTGLGDGYRVDVRIVTWSAPDVVKVPVAALVRSGEGWEAFVLEDGRARRRRVGIGHRAVEEAEVVSGLEAGDEVVLFPPDRLEDGVRARATP